MQQAAALLLFLNLNKKKKKSLHTQFSRLLLSRKSSYITLNLV